MGKHTATYRGVWVKVRLRNGSTFYDRFVERTSSKRLIFDHHEVHVRRVEAFMVIKGGQGV